MEWEKTIITYISGTYTENWCQEYMKNSKKLNTKKNIKI